MNMREMASIPAVFALLAAGAAGFLFARSIYKTDQCGVSIIYDQRGIGITGGFTDGNTSYRGSLLLGDAGNKNEP